MKSALFAVSALILSATSAHATSLRPMHVGAEVIRGQMDSRHLPAQFQGGYVTVDYMAHTVTLSLNTSHACPPGRYCAMYLAAPTVISLPITGFNTDSCGAIQIVASRDARKADGALQVLTVHDYSRLHCPTVRMMAPTEIEYRTVGSRISGLGIEARSVFEAKQLVPLPIRAFRNE